MIDSLAPDSGCPECGTTDQEHVARCTLALKPKVKRFSGCDARLSGHRHCAHGHVVDCPVPGECDLLPIGQ